MKNPENIIGKTFGRLFVNKIHHKVQKYNKKTGAKNGHVYYYECTCSCGNKIVVCGASLRNKNGVSCGCYAHEQLLKRNTTHNLTSHPLYHVWQGMKKRCYNKNDKSFYLYGERGISVCPEWKNEFLNFYNWSIKNGYTEGLTIDRINPNGNYEPSNCRWATPKQQSNNKRNNSFIIHNGHKYSSYDLSLMCNLTQKEITRLIREGRDFNYIVTHTPINTKTLITFKNETHSILEWAQILSIKKGTLKSRLKRGWTIERALSTSKRNP